MDTGKLTGAAEASGGLSKALSERGSEVFSKSNIPSRMWDGADALSASSLLAKQPDPLYDASDAFRKCRAALDDLVTELDAAKNKLGDAHDTIAGTGITIDAAGTVHTPVTSDPADAARNERLATTARGIIDEALQKADTADDSASSSIKGNAANAKLAPEKDIPGDDASTEEVKKWWDSLSESEQQAYIKEHPGKIGNLNGISSADRHEANMVTLKAAAEGGNGDAKKLLEKIEKSWAPGGDENDRIHLLGLEDVSSEDPKIIAALGNPDEAKHTGVYVPGTGTDMGNIGGSIDNMDRLQDAAGESDTSTITWLGYDAPDDIFPDAMGASYAQEGADDLRDYTQGLDVTNTAEDSNLAVIGHSYGSTVVGTADSGGDGLGADDVIAVGSPGMGYESSERQAFMFDSPMVDETSDMHTDDGHIWVGASTNDPVSYTEVHGKDPSRWSFDAERFSTTGSSGHSEYFNEGTKSLDNQAKILSGEYGVEHYGRRWG